MRLQRVHLPCLDLSLEDRSLIGMIDSLITSYEGHITANREYRRFGARALPDLHEEGVHILRELWQKLLDGDVEVDVALQVAHATARMIQDRIPAASAADQAAILVAAAPG